MERCLLVLETVEHTTEGQPSEETRRGKTFPTASFDVYPNIVVLGDSGSGKTMLFKEWAARTRGRYVTARDFLNIPASQFSGNLFIDALDEKRTGRSDQSCEYASNNDPTSYVE